MMVKDCFNRRTADLTIVGKATNTIAIVRTSSQGKKPGERNCGFGIFKADNYGLPITGEGLVLTPSEIRALAEQLAAILDNGELRDTITDAEYTTACQARAAEMRRLASNRLDRNGRIVYID